MRITICEDMDFYLAPIQKAIRIGCQFPDIPM